MFVDDVNPDIVWEARDLLLVRDVRLALEGATKAYKMDILSRLTIGVERGGEASTDALRLLLKDSDPEVRELAQLVINRTTP